MRLMSPVCSYVSTLSFMFLADLVHSTYQRRLVSDALWNLCWQEEQLLHAALLITYVNVWELDDKEHRMCALHWYFSKCTRWTWCYQVSQGDNVLLTFMALELWAERIRVTLVRVRVWEQKGWTIEKQHLQQLTHSVKGQQSLMSDV